MNKNRFKWVW